MKRALLSAAASVLLLSSSCDLDDHSDPSGVYVGAGTGTYVKDGVSKHFTIRDDEVTVKQTSRHYQHSEIEVTVRNCVLHSGGGETSWTFFSDGGRGCAFDVPSIGAVKVKLSGGLSRLPPTQASKPDAVNLVISGSGGEGETLQYTLEAKPKRN